MPESSIVVAVFVTTDWSAYTFPSSIVITIVKFWFHPFDQHLCMIVVVFIIGYSTLIDTNSCEIYGTMMNLVDKWCTLHLSCDIVSKHWATRRRLFNYHSSRNAIFFSCYNPSLSGSIDRSIDRKTPRAMTIPPSVPSVLRTSFHASDFTIAHALGPRKEDIEIRTRFP